MFADDARGENASGVIDSDARLKFGFCFDGFALSDTLVALLFVLGMDGVIERDFGKSGKFMFEPKYELNLVFSKLSLDFVIESDAELESFCCFLPRFDCDLASEDFDELELGVVDVIVVVVIDSELLMRFCWRPVSGLVLLALLP